jgi:hypothetical protein
MNDDIGIKKGISRLIKREQKTTKDATGVMAMHVAINKQIIYRREIERYGVIVEAVENIAISLLILTIVDAIMLFMGKLPFNSGFGIAFVLFEFITFLMLIAGASGYRKLQEFRIITIFKALENRELLKKRKGIKEKLGDQTD